MLLLEFCVVVAAGAAATVMHSSGCCVHCVDTLTDAGRAGAGARGICVPCATPHLASRGGVGLPHVFRQLSGQLARVRVRVADVGLGFVPRKVRCPPRAGCAAPVRSTTDTHPPRHHELKKDGVCSVEHPRTPSSLCGLSLALVPHESWSLSGSPSHGHVSMVLVPLLFFQRMRLSWEFITALPRPNLRQRSRTPCFLLVRSP